MITLVVFTCCLFLQGSFDDFTESSALLLFALKRRRFYMSQSDQEFSSTAGLMLDGEEPPSTTFCLPQSSTGEVKLSFAGDVIGRSVVCVCMFVCTCACTVYKASALGYKYKVML